DRRLAEAFRRRISVGIKEGPTGRASAAGPEAGARHFVAIGLAGDGIGQIGDAAGMKRRGAARKSGDGKIEAAPEEVDRADLAEKARPEQSKDAIGRKQC